ncbi:MAG: DUF3078 domain-containing protein [Bacteroidota bacterium]
MKSIFVIVLALFSFCVLAQEEELKKNAEKLNEIKNDSLDGWKKGGTGTITFSQASLSNWAGGGQNTIAANSFLNLFANYKKGKSTWDNSFDIAYGLIKQGSLKFIKSDDRVDLSSKYGRKAFDHWFYAGLFNFRTQMAPGYALPNVTNKISDFMAPAYITTALGFDYKPKKDFTLFISPLTSKITIVNHDSLAAIGAFGVDKGVIDTLGNITTPGSKVRYELGGYLKFSWKVEILKSAVFTTRLDLFSNYLHNPQNIDVFWENALVVKVGKYIGLNFGTILIYDDDVKINLDTDNDGVNDASGPRVQFKQVFGVGFSYKF